MYEKGQTVEVKRSFMARDSMGNPLPMKSQKGWVRGVIQEKVQFKSDNPFKLDAYMIKFPDDSFGTFDTDHIRLPQTKNRK